jgi:hypothetical protein
LAFGDSLPACLVFADFSCLSRSAEEGRNEKSTRAVKEVRYQMKPKILSVSLILIGVLLAIPLVGGQGGTSYSFTFKCPNVSKFTGCPPSPKQFCPTLANTDIHVGDRLSLEGAGTFTVTSTSNVGGTFTDLEGSGGGTFTHFDSNGSVRDIGTWTVTKFEDFNGTLLDVLLNATTTEGNPLAPPPRFLFLGQISTAPVEGVAVLYIDSGGFLASAATPLFSLVESGCVTINPVQQTTQQTSATTQQPAPPATQDLLTAYGVPAVVALVVIVGLVLLVLSTRKRRKT